MNSIEIEEELQKIAEATRKLIEISNKENISFDDMEDKIVETLNNIGLDVCR